MPRMSTVKLTKRAVDGLTVERGDWVFYDRDLTGFGVRAYASGCRVYVLHAWALAPTVAELAERYMEAHVTESRVVPSSDCGRKKP